MPSVETVKDPDKLQIFAAITSAGAPKLFFRPRASLTAEILSKLLDNALPFIAAKLGHHQFVLQHDNGPTFRAK